MVPSLLLHDSRLIASGRRRRPFEESTPPPFALHSPSIAANYPAPQSLPTYLPKTPPTSHSSRLATPIKEKLGSCCICGRARTASRLARLGRGFGGTPAKKSGARFAL